jgi:hypothetical protein
MHSLPSRRIFVRIAHHSCLSTSMMSSDIAHCAKLFSQTSRKVIDRYSQVIYIPRRSVMLPTTSACSKFSTTRYCAGKGGIVDAD